MAINTFEVGAIFTIQDRAAPVLRELAVQLERIDGLSKSATASLAEFGKGLRLGGLDNRLKSLTESMGGLAAASAELKTSFAADFESINAGLFQTVTMARELAAAMADIGVASAAMARSANMGAAAGAAGGGHGGGFMSGAAKGAGLAAFLNHPATWVAGYMTYESGKAALNEDFDISAAMGDLQIPKERQQAADASLRNTIFETAKGTIFSEAETAKFLPIFTSVAGSQFQDNPEKVSKIFPLIARTAELAQLRGLGSAETSVTAGMGLAHMMGAYEPEQLEGGISALYKAAKVTHTTMQQQEKALKYVLPTGIALGMDPQQVIGTSAFLQQAGLQGSTSGTAFNRFLLATLAGGGNMTSHLTEQMHMLESQMGVKESTIAKSAKGVAGHAEALREIGITDSKGNLLVLDEHGNIDVMKEFEKITQYAGSHTGTQTATKMQQAFGIWAGRVADLFADPDRLPLLQQFSKNYQSAMGPKEEQSFLSGTGLQNVEQFWARLKDVGTSFGMMVGTLVDTSNAIHGVIGGLDTFIGALNTITNHAKNKDPDVSITWDDWKTVFWDNSIDKTKRFEEEHQRELDKQKNIHKESFITGSGQGAGAGMIHISDIHVHTNSENPHDMAEKFLEEVARKLSNAQTHNLGTGDGVYSSPYTSGHIGSA